MSITNILETFLDWAMFHLPSDVTLITSLALLPLIAYPFLPSTDRTRVRCELFLIWPNAVGLALGKLVPALERAAGQPASFSIRGSSWLFTLLAFSTSAGIESLLIPRKRGPKPGDSSFTCTLWFPVATLTIHHSLGLFSNLGEPSSLSGWLGYLFRFLSVAVGVFVVNASIYVCLKDWGPRILFRLVTTRRVSCWFWLPENGAADDFVPPWSIALAVTVVIAPLLAFLVAVVRARGFDWCLSII